MDIGIVTQDATAKGAADSNARQSAQVIELLKSVVPAASIRTINFSVNPNYRFPKEGGPPAGIGSNRECTENHRGGDRGGSEQY
jgi:uncharacterized protein YggE